MNTQLWNFFKQTSEYKSALSSFDTKIDSTQKLLIYAKGKGWIDSITQSIKALSQIESTILEKNLNIYDSSRENYETLIDNLIIQDKKTSNEYRHLLDYIFELSILLYQSNPFYKPMLLSAPFYIFENGCREIGVNIPSYPRSRDYKGFLMLYYDYCRAIQDFEEENNLSPEEMCTCLYEFAPSLLKDQEKTPLPNPIHAWIVGSKKPEHIKQSDMWQCNEMTRRGDIVIVYALSSSKTPSCIHSIWRADSETAFNPFLYYQYQTEITDGVTLSHPITLNMLKEEPGLSNLKMLNNNLQGLNGKNIPAKEYGVILQMIEKAGNDMSNIPIICRSSSWSIPEEFYTSTEKLEKKVEEYILKPFLEKIGHIHNKTYHQQVIVKMGRGRSERPDFVFSVKGEAPHQEAPFFIEVKDNMSSPKKVRDNFSQSLSYANSLRARYMGMCDMNGLYIIERKNGSFDLDSPFVLAPWEQIYGDPNTLQQVLSVMSPEILDKMDLA